MVSIGSASILLVTWLIEIRLRNQDQRLNGDKYLGERRRRGRKGLLTDKCV